MLMSRGASRHATISVCRPGALVLTACLVTSGCGVGFPGKPSPTTDKAPQFRSLFAANCAGCHGADGRLGPAPPLNDALFLALVSDDFLAEVIRDGRSRALMPAFAHPTGGPLTGKQVNVLVRGMRDTWGQQPPVAVSKLTPYRQLLSGPPGSKSGDPARGQDVFDHVCARCHGDKGRGGEKGGPLNDPALLGLLNERTLTRVVITGRPDLGMPNYVDAGKKRASGEPLSPNEIADVVAYVTSWKSSDTSGQD